MTFRLALDGTACTAYAAGSVHVGEILAEVADEHDPHDGPLVAVPVAALITAHIAGADPKVLGLLDGLPYVLVSPLLRGGWPRVASAARLLGRLDRACAALLVATGRCDYVLTAEPAVYGEGIETVEI